MKDNAEIDLPHEQETQNSGQQMCGHCWIIYGDPACREGCCHDTPSVKSKEIQGTLF